MALSDWRTEVIVRDHGECQAPRIDKEAGPCYDKWGARLPPNFDPVNLEADYVRFAAVGGRHQFAVDHVLLCPGHHRGTGPQAGEIWATSHRAHLREYLDSQTELPAKREFTRPSNPDPVSSMAKEVKE